MKTSKLYLLLFCLLSGSFFANAAVDRDSKVKASLIFKFAHAIEWQNPRELTDFRIGLLGANPDMVNELRRTTNRKKEGRFLIKIITFNSIAEVTQTEVLFVDFAKFKSFSLTNIKGNTLLISDNNLYIDKTMLAFIEGNKKLNFEINKENMQRAGLKLSGGFVGLAKKTIRISDTGSDDDLDVTDAETNKVFPLILVKEKDLNLAKSTNKTSV